MTNPIKKILGKKIVEKIVENPLIGKELLQRFAEASPKGFTKYINAVKSFTPLTKEGFKQGAEESLQESVTQFAQDAMNNLYKRPEDKQGMNQMLKTAAIDVALPTFFTGGLFAGGQYLAGANEVNQSRQQTGQITIAEDKKNKIPIEIIGKTDDGFVGYTAKGNRVIVKDENIGETLNIPVEKYNEFMKALPKQKEEAAKIEQEIIGENIKQQANNVADNYGHNDTGDIIRVKDFSGNVFYIKQGDVNELNNLSNILYGVNPNDPEGKVVPIDRKMISEIDAMPRQSFIDGYIFNANGEFERQKSQTEVDNEPVPTPQPPVNETASSGESIPFALDEPVTFNGEKGTLVYVDNQDDPDGVVMFENNED